jgi:hypothetical protein
LLAATEADLEEIRASVEAGRLKDKDQIGCGSARSSASTKSASISSGRSRSAAWAPDEITRVICFLAADASSYIKGRSGPSTTAWTY